MFNFDVTRRRFCRAAAFMPAALAMGCDVESSNFGGKTPRNRGVLEGNRTLNKVSACILLLFLSLPACGEQAARGNEPNGIPGTAYVGPQYYYSDDMNLIEVGFGVNCDHLPEGEPCPPPILYIQAPRAFIFFAPPYSKTEYPTLPDKIRTEVIHMMFIGPENKPVRLGVQDYKREHGGSDRMAIRAMRKEQTTVKLYPGGGRSHRLIEPNLKWETRQEEDYEGLSHYLDSTPDPDSHYYDYKGQYSFDKAKCNNLKTAAGTYSDKWFCHYMVILGGGRFIDMSFVDFRRNGGVAFADRRVREIIDVLCAHIACEAEEKRE